MLTGDRATAYAEGKETGIPMKGATIVFGGSVSAFDADGYAVPAADTAGLVFAGLAKARADNSAGGDGDKEVVVRRRVLARLKGQGLAQDQVGQPMYAVDDETVAASTANSVRVGILMKYISATSGWVMTD